MSNRKMLPLLAALSIALFPARGALCADTPRFPVLGVDPVPDVAELESHAEAIAHWLSLGLSGTVLLHIDADDGLSPLGEGQTAALGELRALAAARAPTPDALDAAFNRSSFETSFVRAAVSLGIAREVYWITPFDYTRNPDPAGSLRADLQAAGVGEEDRRTFALRDGCFRGAVAGTPFAVCGLEALPQLTEPVLIDFDADFILSLASAGSTNPIQELRRLLAALTAKGYAIRDAVHCASVATGEAVSISPFLRWLGEATAQALRDPALLAGPDMPKRWSTMRTLARLMDADNYFELYHQALPYLTIHAADPALQLYIAAALVGRGRPEEALARAEQACRLNRGYCPGLPWLGLWLFAMGDADGGELFFAAAERLRPNMMYGQLPRGFRLLRAGRRQEALRVFQRLSDVKQPFPAAFLAGALHLSLGDRQSARREFDRALEALRTVPDAQVADTDTARAVQEAARLYREEGLVRQAELLEGNPRLRLGQEPAPPVIP
jgi:hypothetical protein